MKPEPLDHAADCASDDPAAEHRVRSAFSALDEAGWEGAIRKEDFEVLLGDLGIHCPSDVYRCTDLESNSPSGTVNYRRFLDWVFSQAKEPPRTTSSSAAVCLEGPGVADWREALARRFGASPREIPDTAQRGITLRQLRRVLDFCKEHCVRWRDVDATAVGARAGGALDMSCLNYYHVNAWVIKPSTLDRPCGDSSSCSFVELVASGAQPPRWYVSHWWGEPMEQVAICIELHCALRGLGEDSPFWISAYANRQNDFFPELAEGLAKANFYKAMQLSSGMLLIVDAPQSQAGPAAVARAFRRLWVRYEQEAALGLADEGDFLLDVATTRAGQACLLAGGAAGVGRSLRRGLAASAEDFPTWVLANGLRATLGQAETTQEEDRRHILNCVAERPLDASPAAAHECYERADRRLRSRLAAAAWPRAAAEGLVEVLGLPQALAADAWRRRLSLDLRRCEPLRNVAALADGLEGLTSLTSLTLVLSACPNLENIEDISRALQKLQHLERLELNLGDCPALASVASLGDAIATLPVLRLLELHLDGCIGLQDFGALHHGLGRRQTRLEVCRLRASNCYGLLHTAGLGRGLIGFGGSGSALRELALDFGGCARLLSPVAEIWYGLAGLRSLRRLAICLAGCERLRSHDLETLGLGLAALGAAPLERIGLGLGYCHGVASVAGLARGLSRLAQAPGCPLRELALSLRGCRGLVAGLTELGDSLLQLRGLENVELDLEGCAGLGGPGLRGLGRALDELRSSPFGRRPPALRVAGPLTGTASTEADSAIMKLNESVHDLTAQSADMRLQLVPFSEDLEKLSEVVDGSDADSTEAQVQLTPKGSQEAHNIGDFVDLN